MADILTDLGYHGENNGQITATTLEDGTNILVFKDNEEIEYSLSMGFPNSQRHTEWIADQIAKEKEEGRAGYYTAHGEELKKESI